MFTLLFPPELFKIQREFISAMGANRDFVWWADTLITEETKELKEAFEAEEQNMDHIFKEIGDLIYVVAGFYNTQPVFPQEVVDKETAERLSDILDVAEQVLSEISKSLRIPVPIMALAFEIVHASNMSKLNPETGKPDRREDGKILKGPNYHPPTMEKCVQAWENFIKNLDNQGTKE